jgi:hypothetical protein
MRVREREDADSQLPSQVGPVGCGPVNAVGKRKTEMSLGQDLDFTVEAEGRAEPTTVLASDTPRRTPLTPRRLGELRPSDARREALTPAHPGPGPQARHRPAR